MKVEIVTAYQKIKKINVWSNFVFILLMSKTEFYVYLYAYIYTDTHIQSEQTVLGLNRT